AMLPGLLAYVPFLCYYLNLDYSLVAQRDWHGPCFAVLGLLALEALPARAGRLVSALAFASALAYRPQAVLFLPAAAAGVGESARRTTESWTRTIRPLAEWLAAFVVSFVFLFCPLIREGAFDDFLRVLGVARYGGTYNRATWESFSIGVKSELVDPVTFTVLI